MRLASCSVLKAGSLSRLSGVRASGADEEGFSIIG